MANSDSQPLFGLADEWFGSRKSAQNKAGGLITKREIRAISLARLGLTAQSVVWDIGAGSGAVSIEAARICSSGQVWAVEKNGQDAEICRRNIEKASLANLTLVEGLAPQVCEGWPAPHSVFVGGSGGQLAQIIELVARVLRPGGKLVINLATLEHLQAALSELARHSFETDLTMVQISRSRPLLNLTGLQALNPVFIVTAEWANPLEEGANHER